MEGLNIALKKAVENDSYKGLEVGTERKLLTHLFFADDVIFLVNLRLRMF